MNKFFGSFVCLKNSMTIFYVGVLVENLYYSKKYLLYNNILYSKKDKIYIKDAISTKQKLSWLIWVIFSTPRSLVLKYFFKTFEIENILDF
jgi:hypothetical protein